MLKSISGSDALPPLVVGVDVADAGEKHPDFAQTSQDPPNRRRDVARRERSRRDLVEQWLEQVVVAAIDHRDEDGRPAERTRCSCSVVVISPRRGTRSRVSICAVSVRP